MIQQSTGHVRRSLPRNSSSMPVMGEVRAVARPASRRSGPAGAITESWAKYVDSRLGHFRDGNGR